MRKATLIITALFSAVVLGKDNCTSKTIKIIDKEKYPSDKYLTTFYSKNKLIYSGVFIDKNNRYVPIGTHYYYQQNQVKQLLEYSFANTAFEGQQDIRLKTYFFDAKQRLEKVTLLDYCTDCEKIPSTVWRPDNNGNLIKDDKAAELNQVQPELWWGLEQNCKAID